MHLDAALPLQTPLALAARVALAAARVALASSCAGAVAALAAQLSPDRRRLLHDREQLLRQEQYYRNLRRLQCRRHGALHRRHDLRAGAHVLN